MSPSTNLYRPKGSFHTSTGVVIVHIRVRVLGADHPIRPRPIYTIIILYTVIYHNCATTREIARSEYV